MPFNTLFCFYFTSDAEKETTVKNDYLESLECVTHRLDQTGPGVIWAGQNKKLTGAGDALKNCLY